MAGSSEDDRGGAAGAAPEPGTTDASAGAAPAQGADGAGGAAPAETGTTEADDGVLQIGPSAEPKGEGAEGGDETARLRDKLSHVQPAHDALAGSMKRVQEMHPDYFDKDGNFTGPQEEPAGEGVLDIGRAAGPSRQAGAPPGAAATAAAPAAAGAPRSFAVDPGEAYRKDFNARALASVFGEDGDPDFVGPSVAIVDARLAQLGITPEALAQRAGGLTREEVQQIVQQGSRAAVVQYDHEVTSFEDRTAAVASEFGDDFLAQKVKFSDTPEMTMKEALPYICARTGIDDPYAAVLVDAKVGPSARKALTRADAVVLANRMVAASGGEQIAPGGGALPGGGPGISDDIEDIGGSPKPLKR